MHCLDSQAVSRPAPLAHPPPASHLQVYDSIQAPGLLTPGALAHFDAEGAEALLYELRFLSVRQRAPVAQYIADNDLRWAAGLGW